MKLKDKRKWFVKRKRNTNVNQSIWNVIVIETKMISKRKWWTWNATFNKCQLPLHPHLWIWQCWLIWGLVSHHFSAPSPATSIRCRQLPACSTTLSVASVLLTADQQLIEAAKLYFISEVCILRVLRYVNKTYFLFAVFFCFKTFFVVFLFFLWPIVQ